MADLGVTLTAFGGMIASFYGMTRMTLTQASKDRDADRQERKLLIKSIKSMAVASEKVATATTQSAKEAKERNGHLGQQNIQIASLVKAQNDDIAEIKDSNETIAKTLKKSAIIGATDKDKLLAHDQFVKEQTVIHQVVKNKKGK